MIKHIVLFKFKKNIGEETVTSFRDSFFGIKNSIPGIISITGGLNISIEGKSKGYNIAFVLTFRDIKDRDNYLPHIKHQQFIEKHINPLIEDVLVFDYEVDE